MSLPVLYHTDIFRVFRAVRLVRLFRIFKFPGLNVYSRILGITFKKASAMFATMLFVSFLAIIVFASVFFSLERGTYDAEQGQ